MIRDQLLGKSLLEKAQIKSHEIAKLNHAGIFVSPGDGVKVEILSLKEINGGVEIMARGWKGGRQLGFGKDNTIEIERFRIFNPPILVPDPNGFVAAEWTDKATGVLRKHIVREDLREAIRQSLAHTVKIVGKENAGIVKGSIGSTTSSFFSGAGDGTVYIENNSWSTARSAATGTAAGPTSPVDTTGTFATGTPRYYIYRAFFPFDTSTLPDTDTITSATFSWMCAADFLNLKGIGLVQTNQASNTTLTTADFDNCGALDGATEGATRLTDVTLDVYSDMALNATALGWVNKTGYTNLGLRGEHDLDNTTPATGQNQYSNIYYSEQAGTTKDPYLTVVHSGGTNYTQTLTEAVVVVDTIAKLDAKPLSEIVTAPDLLVKSSSKSPAETILIVDAVNNRVNRILSDVIVINDTFIKSATKALAEIVTTVDNFSRILSRSLVDFLLVGDGLIKQSGKILSETPAVVDTVSSAIVAKIFTEAVTLADSFIRNVQRVITEVVTVVDGLTRLSGRVLTESLSITDIVWQKFGRLASTWAKTATAAASWVKQSLSSASWAKQTPQAGGFSKQSTASSTWTLQRGRGSGG